jgi:hypothetical protein
MRELQFAFRARTPTTVIALCLWRGHRTSEFLNAADFARTRGSFACANHGAFCRQYRLRITDGSHHIASFQSLDLKALMYMAVFSPLCVTRGSGHTHEEHKLVRGTTGLRHQVGQKCYWIDRPSTIFEMILRQSLSAGWEQALLRDQRHFVACGEMIGGPPRADLLHSRLSESAKIIRR